MLAYGRYHYRYASGREGDWMVVALASQKRYISLYACMADDRGYVAERYAEALPKASIGKSCIRFGRLADVDLGTLETVVRECADIHAATAGGSVLVGVVDRGRRADEAGPGVDPLRLVAAG